MMIVKTMNIVKEDNVCWDVMQIQTVLILIAQLVL